MSEYVASALTPAAVARAAAIALGDSAFIPGWLRTGAKARRWLQRDVQHPLDGPPVLLLPGVHESPRFLDPFAALAAACSRRPHVVTALGRNVARVTETAELAADYLERHDLADVLIVAHSKGGLVGKQLMTWEHTRRRVRSMVAVASPFSGSVFATRAPTRSFRDFSPTNATVRDLAANLAANRDIVSVFPAFDPQIPAGSMLTDARANVRLPVTGHFRVLAHPDLWRLLRTAMREPTAGGTVPSGGGRAPA
ncbi:esterase/lipase family protein [Rathayibacter sp. KR2-224]|uniref:esterase/lipase family protein n=1 Tax=Rathayibacter sp. KR2-224 TaxID=3400913 RepID=UPI003BFCFBE6